MSYVGYTSGSTQRFLCHKASGQNYRMPDCFSLLHDFVTTIGSQLGTKPIGIAKFEFAQGGCQHWFSVQDVHAAIDPEFNGKRSVWVQKKIRPWTNMFKK